MSESVSKSIKVGDTEYTIRPFKGFKFIRAGRIVAQVSEQWKQLILARAEWTREYEQDNMLRITRDMTRQREVFGITDEQFENKQFVEVPDPPSPEEQILGILPKALDLAETQVLQLLALVVAPDAALRKAEEGQEGKNVDEYLKDLGRELMYDGEAQQLTELAILAWDVVNEQFEGKGDRLRPLAQAFFNRGRKAEQERLEKESKNQEASQKPSPVSPLPSPSTTDGQEEKSSGEFPGSSSEPISSSSSAPSA